MFFEFNFFNFKCIDQKQNQGKGKTHCKNSFSKPLLLEQPHIA